MNAQQPTWTDDRTCAQRAANTPMRDWIRGRLTGRLDLTPVVAGLPAELAELVRTVARRTRLWRIERVDVARELAAHFADGLAAGRSPAQLAEDFGDPVSAARLIRRARKRLRPWPWRVYRRVNQAMALLIVLLLAAYLFFLVRFVTAYPSIKRNYMQEFNAPVAKTPEQDRAWPIYRRALMLKGPPTDFDLDVDVGPDRPRTKSWAELRPGDPDWPLMRARLRELGPVLALVREAARKPVMGKFISAQTDVELVRATATDPSQIVEPADAVENPMLINVLLPELGYMRNFTRLMRAEFLAAVDEGDAPRAESAMQTILAMARQVRHGPYLIADLVSVAMFQLASDVMLDSLETHPGAFSEQQLTTLAHAFATYADGGPFRLSLEGEKAMFDDVLQRMFTDDGAGGGRLARGGFALANLIASVQGVKEPRVAQNAMGLEELFTGPVAAVVLADRASNAAMYHRFMADFERWAAAPRWLRRSAPPEPVPPGSQTSALGRIEYIRYLPVNLLTPALGMAVRRADIITAVRDATAFMIAVEIHHRRTGTYPESIDQLPVSLVPKLPIDIADGKPLRYRLVNGRPLLYSLGANLVDDGGVPNNSPFAKDWGRPQWDWMDQDQFDAYSKAPPDVRNARIPFGDWILFPPSAREPKPAPAEAAISEPSSDAAAPSAAPPAPAGAPGGPTASAAQSA